MSTVVPPVSIGSTSRANEPASVAACARCWEASDSSSICGAANAPLVGDQLGRFALGNERVAVEQFLREAASPLFLRLLVDRKADAPHVLDPGRDDRLVDPGGHAQSGEVKRLLARARI